MKWIERLLRRGRMERDLDRELQYHRDRRIADLESQGVDPAQAARQVRLELGGTDQAKEACRDVRGTRWVEDFVRDCRFGLRVLRASPVFTAVAILSLALGIGANTAIFSLIDRLVLRTIPVREPHKLVQITRFHPPYGASSVSYPLFQSLAEGLNSFKGILARATVGPRDIRIDAEPETAVFDLVSGSYYPLLGVHAAFGRTFGAEVDRAPGANPVAVISHRYWERRFASDPAVIGRTFRRLNTIFTIIGVTAPEYFGTVVGSQPEITVPLTMDAEVRGGKSWIDEPNYGWISLMGRLRPGVTMPQARAEVERLFANIRATDAAQATSDQERRAKLGEYVEVKSGANGFDDLRRRVGEPLTILMGMVALVLLSACVNLANLLMAKSAARRREIAVRLAVGAGRGRVMRQLFAEGLLLALAGGALGVLFAYGFDEGLVAMMSNGGPRMLIDVYPDGRVLLFAIAISVAACFLFSLAPAIQTTRPEVQPALAEMRAERWRLGKGLIVAQTAIAVLLLIGAGLFGRTLVNMYTLDPGFERRGVVLFSTNAARLNYTRDQIQQMQLRVPAELETMPGILSASMSMFPPISGGGWDGTFVVEDHPPDDQIVDINSVGIDYFKTFRTRVLSGREFDQRDKADSPRVVVANEAFARYYFAGQSALGKWVAFRGPEQNTHYEIVGVVQDAKYQSLRGDFPRTLYMMNAQVPPGPDSYTFAVKTAAGMSTAAPAIREALVRVDAALRPANVISLEDHVERSLLRERMLAILTGFFGALALLLSAVGIYGTMAFQVARRRREIGIRMALGAEAAEVIGMVLRQTARLTLAGCAIGAVAGLAVTRVAHSILYGVGPDDPLTFIVAVVGLLLIALAAAYVPGRRASRTNLTETLRVN